MEQPKVFIYIPDYWESEKRALDRLVAVLPQVTNENEFSFKGVGYLSHRHCIEAQSGRRKHEVLWEVRALLGSRSQIPFVVFLDLSRPGTEILKEIKRIRRWFRLAIFILYCSDDEFQRCLSELPEDWRIRLSRFFRLTKTTTTKLRLRLRELLNAAGSTAIDKVKNVRFFSAFIR